MRSGKRPGFQVAVLKSPPSHPNAGGATDVASPKAKRSSSSSSSSSGSSTSASSMNESKRANEEPEISSADPSPEGKDSSGDAVETSKVDEAMNQKDSVQDPPASAQGSGNIAVDKVAVEEPKDEAMHADLPAKQEVPASTEQCSPTVPDNSCNAASADVQMPDATAQNAEVSHSTALSPPSKKRTSSSSEDRMKERKKRARTSKADKTTEKDGAEKSDDNGDKKSIEDGKKTSKKDVKKEVKPRGRSAFAIFCADKREEVHTANPGIGSGDTFKALAGMWKNATGSEKQKYKTLATAEKVAASLLSGQTEHVSVTPSAATNGDDFASTSTTECYESYCAKNWGRVEKGLGEGASFQEISDQLKKEWRVSHGTSPNVLQTAKSSSKSESTAKKAQRALPAPRARKPIPAEKELNLDSVCASLEVDDDTNIESVLAQAQDGSYVVKLRGDGYTQLENMAYPIDAFGKCSDAPLALAIKAFRDREKTFKKELASRTEDGILDLDDLEEGSPLEVLAFLGNMREDVLATPGSKLPEPDVWMKVPMLGLCQVLQGMLDAERSNQAQLRKELEAAEGALKMMSAPKAGLQREE